MDLFSGMYICVRMILVNVRRSMYLCVLVTVGDVSERMARAICKSVR